MRPLRLLALAAGTLLAGCSFAPTYQAPAVAMPAAWRDKGPWQTGTPADQLSRGSWWRLFGDDTLSGLEVQVISANTTLAAALAHYDAERQLLVEARSGLFPSITGGGSMSRNRQSDNRPLRGSNQPDVYNADTVGLGLNYEADLWGQVRNQVDAGTATTQAAAADLESLRLSLQATLATDYFRLRGLDAEAELLTQAVADYSKALKLTQLRHEGGIASGIDVGRAETQLESASAAAQDVAAQRALYEHALAVLVGEPASSVSLAPAVVAMTMPHIPVGVPATLLQRRPDIAAAERRLAAANAEIGVARAAYFPVIDIDATGGYQSTSVAHWLSAPNSFWSLGPSALVTVFDAGLHKAQVAEARDRYVEASADYRGRVLGAFAEVEDNLALLDDYAAEAGERQSASTAATHTEALAMDRYREGVVNYLDVVTAQTAALQAQQDVLALATQRLQASVGLIRALGGGWSRDALPGAESLARAAESGQGG